MLKSWRQHVWARSRRWSDRPGSWSLVLGCAWLGLAAGLVGATWVFESFRLRWITAGYLWLTLLASPACLAAYWIDKRRAQADGWRVPEKTLHLMALCGGWPGGLLGRTVFRHKTRKLGFRVISWLIIAAHALLVWFIVNFRVL